MDRIKETLEKGKQRLQNAGLVFSIWGYAILAVAAAAALTMLTRSQCYNWIDALQVRSGEIWVGGLEVWGASVWFTGRIPWQGRVLVYMYDICPVVYLAAALFVMANIVVRKKVKTAATAVGDSLRAMSVGDLSHETAYQDRDEMGELGRECETLRRYLIQEKKGRYETQEGQRKINAAFAHDVRTPLTVIRGYTEFLLKYVPQGKISEEMLAERLELMLYQENRLLEFVGTMSKIQGMEQRELHCIWLPFSEVWRQLELLALCLEDEVEIKVEAEAGADEERLLLDMNAVMEAFENVLNNSLRYAAKKIFISLRAENGTLCIYVKDDGPGFTARALREGAQFYYSEEKDSGGDRRRSHHFGMGLSIARMLCEKHGGTLTMMNSLNGGAIVGLELGTGSW